MDDLLLFAAKATALVTCLFVVCVFLGSLFIAWETWRENKRDRERLEGQLRRN